MLDLRDVVKQCAERLERFQRNPHRLGEQNTKASLISPIIEALGWDLRDPDEVSHEYRRKGTDNPVDYALLLLHTPRLFIEAKGLGENLDVPRWANQTIAYATAAGVEWVALTDGMQWRIYNAHAPVPIEQKLFRAVRIDDPERAVELLSLLSKENMRDHRIDELWKSFFVDRQVHAELTSMFSGIEPAAELVALLDRRLPRLTTDEIRTSLIRAHATFDFAAPVGQPVLPSGTAENPPHLAITTPPALPGNDRPIAGRRTQQAVTAQERLIKVTDMIAAGRLRPGAALHGDYRGITHYGELLADGRVRYNGQIHSTLSAAGRAVKLETLGADAPESKISTDGLGFWHTTDSVSGDVVRIKEIRRRTARDLDSSLDPGGM
ncbi:hypothetical protein GCM10010112_59610 [Actinoplanes lobatus]|uniref:RAMA domain-containing protein n=1 Tax=Actinoplanes lobatus TaxID=113568 RepID=A0A7W7HR11_9ACTN|nr:restriction endonuclease [Actinoplanes lobatus]MBB4755052.1 hypothetical protein [Actinoplanes lobatus]GGN82330.1 hypothetical protein GCM10010112_59610 [Actinoplanes lobatus]GIE40630.1 hypothetical protein Alo02nite_35280 [Actinoplanes lobatus]